MTDVKSWLYGWLGKFKIKPEYRVKVSGPPHRQRFVCELSVSGHDYLASGNSLSKKDAQSNAANDFLLYLTNSGKLSASEIPVFSLSASKESVSVTNQTLDSTESSSKTPEVSKVSSSENLSKRSTEKESIDANSAFFGDWNIENAKSMLHQFMQSHKIKADYKYSSSGPDHSKSFISEMSLVVPGMNQRISASEEGPNKQTASKKTSLSLVRQLFTLGLIEPFSGSLKKKTKTQIPFPVTLEPETFGEIIELLRSKGLFVPRNLSESHFQDDGSQFHISSYSSLYPWPQKSKVDSDIIYWSPPSRNWNPWTGVSLGEELTNLSLESLSKTLFESWTEKQRTSEMKASNTSRSLLPIFEKKDEILESIRRHSVILIRGNTGCGKTTQVCQFILDDFIGSYAGAKASILVTQPRRISAISVADRVATERHERLGESSGYCVRFDSHFPRSHGSIFFCTVGVLLRKLEYGLRGISHVIVDEIHERDVNTDFILIVLRDMSRRYPELRVILMSATMDTTLFSEYFDDCPIIEVPGRNYPIQEYFLEDIIEMTHFKPSYSPFSSSNGKKQYNNRKNKNEDEDVENELENDEDDDVDEEMRITIKSSHPYIVSDEYSAETKTAVKVLMEETDLNFELVRAIILHIDSLSISGAILIFLPGWSLIFSLMKWLQSHLKNLPSNSYSSSYLILPLHSMLRRDDQRKAFTHVGPRVRKIILSTNIAESSITIDDVVFVIDSAKVKTKLFTSHNNMTNYGTVWASKTNLQQRRGRAGRLRSGFAFHLISRSHYNSLDEHNTPEILRCSLSEISLFIKLSNLGSISVFLSKALQPPPSSSVREAEILLRDLKCLDEHDELTPLGRLLAKLPLHPRLGKMLITGTVFGVGNALSTLTALASTGIEVFDTEGSNGRCTFYQRKFSGTRFSDHIAALHVFSLWEKFGDSKLGPGINTSSFPSTKDVKNQILELLKSFGFPESCLVSTSFNYEGPDENLDLVIGLLALGTYPNVALHKDKRRVITMEYKGALFHKSSVNVSSESSPSSFFPYPFFVFGEKLRTQIVSCKTLSNVSPLQLLLFASKKIQRTAAFSSSCVLRVDDWLLLEMSEEAAGVLLSLRPLLDSLIYQISLFPESITDLQNSESLLLSCIRKCSRLVAHDSKALFKRKPYGTIEDRISSIKRQCVYDSLSSSSSSSSRPSFSRTSRNGNEDSYSSESRSSAPGTLVSNNDYYYDDSSSNPYINHQLSSKCFSQSINYNSSSSSSSYSSLPPPPPPSNSHNYSPFINPSSYNRYTSPFLSQNKSCYSRMSSSSQLYNDSSQFSSGIPAPFSLSSKSWRHSSHRERSGSNF